MPVSPSPSAPHLSEGLAPLLAQWRHRPGALLPLLQAVQQQWGWVPPDAVAPIAQALNLSRAEVHGVLTHYPALRTQPPGRHVLQVCQAEACRACGAEALMGWAAEHLGCAPGSTRGDGAVTLEPVYCLGLCAQSPSATWDGVPMARVTADRLARLLRRAEENVSDGAGSGADRGARVEGGSA